MGTETTNSFNEHQYRLCKRLLESGIDLNEELLKMIMSLPNVAVRFLSLLPHLTYEHVVAITKKTEAQIFTLLYLIQSGVDVEGILSLKSQGIGIQSALYLLMSEVLLKLASVPSAVIAALKVKEVPSVLTGVLEKESNLALSFLNRYPDMIGEKMGPFSGLSVISSQLLATTALRRFAIRKMSKDAKDIGWGVYHLAPILTIPAALYIPDPYIFIPATHIISHGMCDPMSCIALMGASYFVDRIASPALYPALKLGYLGITLLNNMVDASEDYRETNILLNIFKMNVGFTAVGPTVFVALSQITSIPQWVNGVIAVGAAALSAAVIDDPNSEFFQHPQSRNEADIEGAHFEQSHTGHTVGGANHQYHG